MKENTLIVILLAIVITSPFVVTNVVKTNTLKINFGEKELIISAISDKTGLCVETYHHPINGDMKIEVRNNKGSKYVFSVSTDLSEMYWVSSDEMAKLAAMEKMDVLKINWGGYTPPRLKPKRTTAI